MPDEIEPIAELIRREAPRVDFFIATGGLGGTPDDLTREAIAYTFGVPQEEVPELAADLRARFTRDPEYAARWALLPRGARPLREPARRRARASCSRTSTCCRGCRRRWRRCSTRSRRSSARGSPIGAWRQTYRTRESVIAPALVEVGERWPGVLVGSYPTFGADGPSVEVVVKSSDADELAAASGWLARALEERS